MAYLLDANVFIQAKNLYYGFDFCPAFWDWLIASNFDPLDGGVRDTAIAGSEKYSNVAGFTIMALLRFAALTPVEGQTGR